MASVPDQQTRHRVQAHGRDTSWEAALLQTPERTAPLYRAIYQALLDAPMTDEELLAELSRYLPVSPSGCRTRRAELVNAGWVEEDRDDSGQVVKRRGSTGTLRIVWAAVPALGDGLW